MAERGSVQHGSTAPLCPGPDDYNCKRCGQVVRYAVLRGQRAAFAYDVPQVLGAGYQLAEEETDDGPTGRWLAAYVKVADRQPDALGFRQHNCPGVDNG